MRLRGWRPKCWCCSKSSVAEPVPTCLLCQVSHRQARRALLSLSRSDSGFCSSASPSTVQLSGHMDFSLNVCHFMLIHGSAMDSLLLTFFSFGRPVLERLPWELSGRYRRADLKPHAHVGYLLESSYQGQLMLTYQLPERWQYRMSSGKGRFCWNERIIKISSEWAVVQLVMGSSMGWRKRWWHTG